MTCTCRFNFARSFIAICIAFFSIGVSVAQTPLPEPSIKTSRPNVVIFFIDDLGYMDLGCYGSSFYETPNIDALASRSMRFTNFYSANPVCSPTRAALMTGKAPQRVGITQWIPQPNELHLPLDEVTIGEAFRSAGYQTGYIGKWHLGEKDSQLPNEQGFEWMRAVNRAGQPGSYFHPFKRKNKNKNRKSYWDVPDLDHTNPGDYLTDKITDQSLEFISKNSDKPFLLCFSHYAVHTPIESPKTLVEKFESKKAKNFEQATVAPASERNGSNTRTRQDSPQYAAMIENLDFNVGRVLTHLEQLNLTQKTIVLFTSDNGGLTTLKRKNGGPTSVRPLRAGKGWTYEGGIRIPTMFSWPSHIAAGTSSQLGITMDIYPTLLSLAGLPAKPKQHLDGISLHKTLKTGEVIDHDRVLAWTYPHHHGSGHSPSNAIRQGDWKLVHLTDTDKHELYNLKNDLGESEDIAEKNPEIVNELSRQLKQWVESTTLSSKNQ